MTEVLLVSFVRGEWEEEGVAWWGEGGSASLLVSLPSSSSSGEGQLALLHQRVGPKQQELPQQRLEYEQTWWVGFGVWLTR